MPELLQHLITQGKAILWSSKETEAKVSEKRGYTKYKEGNIKACYVAGLYFCFAYFRVYAVVEEASVLLA